MIREEFKKQQQKKNLTEKDLMKIREMGERAYYTSSINKMRNTISGMKFLMVFALIFAIIITVTMAIILIYFKGFNGHAYNVVAFVFGIVLWGIIALWQFVIKPHYKKRIELFSQYVKEISDKEMAKQQAIYNKFIKEKTENKSEKGE